MNNFSDYLGKKKFELMVSLERCQMHLMRQLPNEERELAELNQREVTSQINFLQDIIDHLPQKEKDLAEKHYKDCKENTFYDSDL